MTNIIDTFGAEYANGIIPFFHMDTNGNIVSKQVSGDTYTIKNNIIVLEEFPDLQYGLTITYDDKLLQRVEKNYLSLGETEYVVDTTTGFIHFHSFLDGKQVQVEDYYGKGLWLIDDTRIIADIEKNADGTYNYQVLSDVVSDAKGFLFKGDWVDNVEYTKNNIVIKDSTLYICTKSHTSSWSCQPSGANDCWSAVIDVGSMVYDEVTMYDSEYVKKLSAHEDVFATGTQFGHVKLSDASNSDEKASSNIAATPYAVSNALGCAKNYTDNAIKDLVDSAPSALNTLNELAQAIQENQDVVEALDSAITKKQDTIIGAANSITDNDLTANRVLISNANGKVSVSDVTSMELSCLDGVTSNIQTQLDEHKTEFDEHTNKIASDENAAHVKLSDSTVSDSDAENGYYAATPKAVNDLRLILTEKIEGAEQNLTEHSIHYGDSTNKPGHVYVTQELVATGTIKDDYTVPSIEAVINLKNSINKKAEANIKKKPTDTTGDIIDTHLTVGNSGFMGARSFSSGGDEDSEGNSNIAGANDSATVGGYLNKVESTANGSVILGGWDNTITPSFSAIMGGESNQIGEKCYNSAIIGGANNELVGDAEYMPVRGVIVGGQHNQIDGDGRNSIILGGQHNRICNNGTAESSAIIGGYHALANDYNTAVGRYNIDPGSPLGETDTNGDVFVIGIGTSAARKNGFRVAYDGNCYAATAMNSTGADYAECWEWIDGNPNCEDRIGRFVVFKGDKIQVADENSDIRKVGIISGNPAVVGDNYADEWCGKYLKDKYGRLITEHKVYAEVLDDEGNVVQKAYEADEYVLNPDYDPEQEYIPRAKRSEWSPVGTHGKLVVIDDGTCEVDGFCVPTTGGIATASDDGFYVMERIDETHIRVYIK